MIPMIRWKSSPKPPDEQLVYREEPKAVQPPNSIKVELRGLGPHSGMRYIEYSEGANLGYYLHLLRLKHLIEKCRIIDLLHPELGRRRMSYTPEKDSHIIILPSGVGLATQWQRSSVDAQELARNMDKGAFAVERRIK